jgi:uncharacterized protein YbaR (Trm112 family)
MNLSTIFKKDKAMKSTVVPLFLTFALTLPANAQMTEISGNESVTLGAIDTPDAETLDILACPYDVLKNAYLNVLNHKDALNAAAVETDVLTICTERQGLIRKILDNESKLVAILKKSEEAEIALHKPFIEQISNLEADLVNCQASKIAGNTGNISANVTYDDDSLSSLQTLPASTGCQSSEYLIDWISISKNGGHKASLTSATQSSLVVGVGDTLPSGAKVSKISKGIVEVETHNGFESLPMNLEEPPVSDDGLIWQRLPTNSTFKVLKETK